MAALLQWLRFDKTSTPPERVGVRTYWGELLDGAVDQEWQSVEVVMPKKGSGASDRKDNLVLIEDLLSRDECARLVSSAEAVGFGETGFPKEYRGNLRLITTDPTLAAALWTRLAPFVPAITDDGTLWDAYGLNERFRMARYSPGDHFGTHVDAYFERSSRDRSMFTVNCYLNDVIDGGATRFFDSRTDTEASYSVAPVAGRAVAFRQPPAVKLYHDGERLGSGVKYLLRTDVMYRRRDASQERVAAS